MLVCSMHIAQVSEEIDFSISIYKFIYVSAFQNMFNVRT